MSLERRERRRCDICHEVISDAQYYECTQKRAPKADVHTTVNEVATFTYGSISSTNVICGNPAQLDVCLNCWDKMTR